MGLTQEGKKKIALKLQKRLRRATADLSAFSIDAVLENTPKEVPGRMQAAWLNSLQKLDIFDTDVSAYTEPVISRRTSEAAEEWDNSWKYGFADVFDQPLKITVKLLNVLEFASIVEYGGPIEVGVDGNIGPKIDKVFPGQLDSPRLASGHGMLTWVDEAGQMHRAFSRDMTGSNSIAKSIGAIRLHAKSLGFV